MVVMAEFVFSCKPDKACLDSAVNGRLHCCVAVRAGNWKLRNLRLAQLEISRRSRRLEVLDCNLGYLVPISTIK